MLKNYLDFSLKYFLNFFEKNYFYHKNAILKILGADIYKNLLIENKVIFNISKPENLSIGKNVKIGENTLIKIRENGILKIEENCVVEENCRIISAREGVMIIKKNW